MAPWCHAKEPELNLLLLMCVPPSWSATPASFERQMKRHPGLLLPKGNRKTSVHNEKWHCRSQAGTPDALLQRITIRNVYVAARERTWLSNIPWSSTCVWFTLTPLQLWVLYPTEDIPWGYVKIKNKMLYGQNRHVVYFYYSLLQRELGCSTSVCSTWSNMSENAEFHTHLYSKWFDETEWD